MDTWTGGTALVDYARVTKRPSTVLLQCQHVMSVSITIRQGSVYPAGDSELEPHPKSKFCDRHVRRPQMLHRREWNAAANCVI